LPKENFNWMAWQKYFPENGLEISCNTQGCIAGWIHHLVQTRRDWKEALDKALQQRNYREDTYRYIDKTGYEEMGRVFLGLTSAEASWLFYGGDHSYTEVMKGSTRLAVRYLDWLIAGKD